MLQPEQYFPCFAYVEKQAVWAVYNSFVPLYFVVPCAPVDAVYAASELNFEGRQEAFENMFRVTREEIEIVEGFPPVECYVGFWEYYITWLLYPPISDGTPYVPCFQNDYSNV